MTIVQRVGRVNRIGNEKDIDVINYVPSDEIEVIVGVLQKLKQKKFKILHWLWEKM